MNENKFRSAIDIGTNTVLLLIAEQSEKGLKPIFEEQQIPRLGKGVDAQKYLAEDSIQRVLNALLYYKKILNEQYPDAAMPIVTATSAVRDASNRDNFIHRVKNETGWSIRLLSGSEEAEWTYAGALSMLKILDNQSYVVIDIGGGSTELAFGKGLKLISRHSFDMGSVRFTERFLKGNPPSANVIKEAENEIRNQFSAYPEPILLKHLQVVGVAGTVTSMAYIKLGLKAYEIDKISDIILSNQDIEDLFILFSTHSSEQMLERFPIVMKGRSDVFLAGIMILRGFMQHFGFSHLKVSSGGIRHGALLKTC
jgi:exopolyphosphatase/guanosine-5'-triphosphate,3'-diphosphate pyrophosphatase